MKIYFAGSISGGRQDQGLYFQIVDLLKKYGEVLTEHVANKNISSYGENLMEDYIYKRDINWLLQSDAVVAEVTVASTGVGYEVARAEVAKKKVLCVWREVTGSRPSSMILGNNHIKIERYKDLKDLTIVFNNFFTSLS
jgi:nucleoside 2-deoxyribosyltransferase